MSQSAGASDDRPYVLGVDGGGTKTEAWLARCEPQGPPSIVGRGRAGSSNPRAVGLDLALANLAAAIDAAWLDAGASPRTVAAAVLGISGAGHASVRVPIRAWAEGCRLAVRTSIVHDADPLLAAGTPAGWGVALIVGTGSAAIGVDRAGRRDVVGGWGYWFGDEGGAYWIGRQALAAVARAADGRGAATGLTPAIAEQLGVEDPRAILGALEQSGNVRGAIAGLATTVGRVADAGDAAAGGIVEAAAAELAEMVACAAAKLELGPEFPLALGGGVICGSDLLRGRLTAALDAKGLRPSPVQTVPHPAAGCIKLACESLGL